ncbi:DUF2637 domain-containing protein [Streptomyces sp. NBC_01381]|uniref:DUF2637 domain-containing protein n=1 Tax=Streptomyces sp. NBC_01381 TaxID=2903845 RepID=UPI0022542422|nr:DUF2637 domain-containing protein [Streptomyces sp. NBC_01381]MCX4668975.1 DUF2637 domain-containing protein [Streptomyces sp. NBC_01381]
MKARLRRVDPILIQAVIAAALSFAHIHDIAEAAGQTGWKAWAYPVSVDFLMVMVMAWKRIRTPDVPKRAAWFWLLTFLAASLGANIATAGVLDIENLPVELRVLVAGWPAVAFLGGSLLVHTRMAPAGAGDVQAVDEEPKMPAGEPCTEPVEMPILVSHREAAEALGVAEETVPGLRRAGLPDAEELLDDPAWVKWRGGRAHHYEAG